MNRLDRHTTWAEEKNAGPVSREDRPAPVAYLSEILAGGSYMECCGECRCVCVCPDCGEPSVTGMQCARCESDDSLHSPEAHGARMGAW